MVDEVEVSLLNLDRCCRVCQDLDRIALFEIILANSRVCRFARERQLGAGLDLNGFPNDSANS